MITHQTKNPFLSVVAHNPRLREGPEVHQSCKDTHNSHPCLKGTLAITAVETHHHLHQYVKATPFPTLPPGGKPIPIHTGLRYSQRCHGHTSLGTQNLVLHLAWILGRCSFFTDTPVKGTLPGCYKQYPLPLHCPAWRTLTHRLLWEGQTLGGKTLGWAS